MGAFLWKIILVIFKLSFVVVVVVIVIGYSPAPLL